MLQGHLNIDCLQVLRSCCKVARVSSISKLRLSGEKVEATGRKSIALVLGSGQRFGISSLTSGPALNVEETVISDMNFAQ